jgi:nitroreductase
MDVREAIRKRRSVRDFLDREIPHAIVEQLEEALIQAPSAGNLQSRKFYFVKDPAVKNRLVRAALGQRFIARAPLVVVGCADARISRRYGERGVFLYSIQDVSVSIMNMMLAATAAGLGTVWVGAFDEEGVAGVLDLPGHLRPVAIVPVGYPKSVPSPPPRVTREEAITDV